MTIAPARPKVVALVPAWTASAFISETLDALAAQSFPNLEILISDDASPDSTAEICERHASRDTRFRVIRQPRNLGWTGNVNALLQHARGDYFLFAGHDDLLEPAYVERCIAALEANPAAILAFSDTVVVEQDGRRRLASYTRLDGVANRLQRALWIARRKGDWWIAYRGVFRAPAARAIGGLRRHPAGEFAADWPWLLHMSLLGEFVRIPERLCTKIYRQTSLSPGWSFGVRSWSGATLSAIGAVSRAKIRTREKLMLHATLVRLVGRQLKRAIRPRRRGLRKRSRRHRSRVERGEDQERRG